MSREWLLNAHELPRAKRGNRKGSQKGVARPFMRGRKLGQLRAEATRDLPADRMRAYLSTSGPDRGPIVRLSFSWSCRNVLFASAGSPAIHGYAMAFSGDVLTLTPAHKALKFQADGAWKEVARKCVTTDGKTTFEVDYWSLEVYNRDFVQKELALNDHAEPEVLEYLLDESTGVAVLVLPQSFFKEVPRAEA